MSEENELNWEEYEAITQYIYGARLPPEKNLISRFTLLYLVFKVPHKSRENSRMSNRQMRPASIWIDHVVFKWS